MKPPVQFHWKGNHHSYYGVFFIIFGLFNWYMAVDNGNLATLIPFWQLFIILGSYFIADDIIEHNITESTPLRILYKLIFRL